MANNEQSFLRSIFLEIIKGYSCAKINNDYVKIKHFDLEDQSKIDDLYQGFLEEGLRRGLPSEKKRLESLNHQGYWTKNDEDKIFNIQSFLSRLEQTLSKANLPSQRDALQSQIDDEKNKLNKLKLEKANFIGKTAEVFANKKLNESFIHFAVRKNDEINTLYYSDDEFQDLEDAEIDKIISIFNESVGRINGNVIKKITLQPFFQNYFYLTDSISEFWGKSILELTSFQSELSFWGRHFRQIIQNSETKIPDEILRNPDELVKFMNLNAEAQKSLANTKGELGASSNPNMTPEDYKKMGIKVENPESVWVRKKFAETGIKSLTGREQAELRQNGSIKKWDV